MLTHETQHERLEALYHLSVELSAQGSLDSVLNTALTHCLKLTDSQFGFIGLNTPEQQALDVVATQGFHPSKDFYYHFHLIPLRPNIFAHVVLNNTPIRSEDATVDPRRVGQPKGHPPVHTFLGVPLRIKDQPIGMIGVANRPDPYQDEHEQLLMTYAAQVAIVIRNAQLYETLEKSNETLERTVRDRTSQLEKTKESLAQKAKQLRTLLGEQFDIQEQERQRIAQGMHDGINQLLYGALFELKSAERKIENENTSAATNTVQRVQSILHQVETEIQRTIHDLRPPTLDKLGLVPALRRHAEQFETYTTVQCAVNSLGEPRRLPSNLEINIYRSVQEALQNIHHHAQASRATVLLVFTPRTLKVTIADDGLGFDPSAVDQRNEDHLGLLGMRERAESLGGQLTINSKKGQGTQLEITVPIKG